MTERPPWLGPGTLGPLTRSVLDSAIVYDVIKGSTAEDQFQAPPAGSYVEALDKDLGRLRIGWSLKHSARGVRVLLRGTPAGKAVDWQGSRGGGSVTAAQPYRVGSQDCRQYTQTVNAGGQSRSARGTACRNPDGSWTPLT